MTANLTTGPGTDEIAAPLLAFLAEQTKRDWAIDEDLFETGVSSLFAMQLVVFVEKTYAVEIGGEDLKLGNFRSVAVMVELVRRLRDE